ncbi:hypothetical protein RFI_15760, partial [Reticulomyxa filosa]
ENLSALDLRRLLNPESDDENDYANENGSLRTEISDNGIGRFRGRLTSPLLRSCRAIQSEIDRIQRHFGDHLSYKDQRRDSNTDASTRTQHPSRRQPPRPDVQFQVIGRVMEASPGNANPNLHSILRSFLDSNSNISINDNITANNNNSNSASQRPHNTSASADTNVNINTNNNRSTSTDATANNNNNNNSNSNSNSNANANANANGRFQISAGNQTQNNSTQSTQLQQRNERRRIALQEQVSKLHDVYTKMTQFLEKHEHGSTENVENIDAMHKLQSFDLKSVQRSDTHSTTTNYNELESKQDVPLLSNLPGFLHYANAVMAGLQQWNQSQRNSETTQHQPQEVADLERRTSLGLTQHIYFVCFILYTYKVKYFIYYFRAPFFLFVFVLVSYVCLLCCLFRFILLCFVFVFFWWLKHVLFSSNGEYTDDIIFAHDNNNSFLRSGRNEESEVLLRPQYARQTMRVSMPVTHGVIVQSQTRPIGRLNALLPSQLLQALQEGRTYTIGERRSQTNATNAIADNDSVHATRSRGISSITNSASNDGRTNNNTNNQNRNNEQMQSTSIDEKQVERGERRQGFSSIAPSISQSTGITNRNANNNNNNNNNNDNNNMRSAVHPLTNLFDLIPPISQDSQDSTHEEIEFDPWLNLMNLFSNRNTSATNRSSQHRPTAEEIDRQSLINQVTQFLISHINSSDIGHAKANNDWYEQFFCLFVFFGRKFLFVRLYAPLQEFLKRSVLENDTPVGRDTLAADLASALGELISSECLSENRDRIQTWTQNYFNIHCQHLIAVILDCKNEIEFEQKMLNWGSHVISQWFYELTLSCQIQPEQCINMLSTIIQRLLSRHHTFFLPLSTVYEDVKFFFELGRCYHLKELQNKPVSTSQNTNLQLQENETWALNLPDSERERWVETIRRDSIRVPDAALDMCNHQLSDVYKTGFTGYRAPIPAKRKKVKTQTCKYYLTFERK